MNIREAILVVAKILIRIPLVLLVFGIYTTPPAKKSGS